MDSNSWLNAVVVNVHSNYMQVIACDHGLYLHSNSLNNHSTLQLYIILCINDNKIPCSSECLFTDPGWGTVGVQMAFTKKGSNQKDICRGE